VIAQSGKMADVNEAAFSRLNVLSSFFLVIIATTRMWANAQRDGRPAEYRWRPLFNAAMFG